MNIVCQGKTPFFSAVLSMGFKAESSRPKGANSPLWSPKTARQRRAVFGLDSKM